MAGAALLLLPASNATQAACTFDLPQKGYTKCPSGTKLSPAPGLLSDASSYPRTKSGGGMRVPVCTGLVLSSLAIDKSNWTW